MLRDVSAGLNRAGPDFIVIDLEPAPVAANLGFIVALVKAPVVVHDSYQFEPRRFFAIFLHQIHILVKFDNTVNLLLVIVVALLKPD